MRRDRLRTSSPFAPSEKHVLDRLGVDTQSDLRRRDRDSNVRTPDRRRVVVCTTLGPFFREDVGGSGAGAYDTRLIAPNAAATFNSTTTALGYRAATAGVVVRAYLWSNAARSAGSCLVRVRITDGSATTTDYDFTDCVLDGAAHPESGYTRDQRASQYLSLSDGIPYAAGDLITVRFVTDAGWAPTTADCGAQIVCAETEDTGG
jgi:hypothetical protein